MGWNFQRFGTFLASIRNRYLMIRLLTCCWVLYLLPSCHFCKVHEQLVLWRIWWKLSVVYCFESWCAFKENGYLWWASTIVCNKYFLRIFWIWTCIMLFYRVRGSHCLSLSEWLFSQRVSCTLCASNLFNFFIFIYHL